MRLGWEATRAARRPPTTLPSLYAATVPSGRPFLGERRAARLVAIVRAAPDLWVARFAAQQLEPFGHAHGATGVAAMARRRWRGRRQRALAPVAIARPTAAASAGLTAAAAERATCGWAGKRLALLVAHQRAFRPRCTRSDRTLGRPFLGERRATARRLFLRAARPVGRTLCAQQLEPFGPAHGATGGGGDGEGGAGEADGGVGAGAGGSARPTAAATARPTAAATARPTAAATMAAATARLRVAAARWRRRRRGRWRWRRRRRWRRHGRMMSHSSSPMRTHELPLCSQ